METVSAVSGISPVTSDPETATIRLMGWNESKGSTRSVVIFSSSGVLIRGIDISETILFTLNVSRKYQ